MSKKKLTYSTTGEQKDTSILRGPRNAIDIESLTLDSIVQSPSAIGSDDTPIKSAPTLTKKEKKSTNFSYVELFRFLLPYFWPGSGLDGAFINRVRSTSTWLMVQRNAILFLCDVSRIQAGRFIENMQSLRAFFLVRGHQSARERRLS